MKRILSLVLVVSLAGCRAGDRGGDAIEACDLGQQVCMVNSAWGPLRIDVMPRPVRTMREQYFEVRFAGPATVLAQLDLEGIEMDMGPNRTRLRQGDDGVWRATLYVPVCATGAMRWRLGLSLFDGGAPAGRWFFPLSVGSGA